MRTASRSLIAISRASRDQKVDFQAEMIGRGTPEISPSGRAFRSYPEVDDINRSISDKVGKIISRDPQSYRRYFGAWPLPGNLQRLLPQAWLRPALQHDANGRNPPPADH